MNNTTRRRTTLAILAILIAATLVVGTFATTTTLTQRALAYSQKKKDNEKGNDNNSNTVTIQKCKQAATQSGFDNNQGQECENVICTHPGENATCTEEGVRSISTPTSTSTSTSTPTPEPITTTLRVIKKVVCQPIDPGCSLPVECVIDVGRTQSFDCEDAIGNGVLVTLQPGHEFFISESQAGSVIFRVTLEGDCDGTIAEGQHLTCTVTNTEP
jgi:hypothetical protein